MIYGGIQILRKQKRGEGGVVEILTVCLRLGEGGKRFFERSEKKNFKIMPNVLEFCIYLRLFVSFDDV